MKSRIYALIFLYSVLVSPVFAQFNYLLEEKFWMANGQVHTMAQHNQKLYLGGSFTYLGPLTGNAGIVDLEGNLIPGSPVVNGTIHTIIEDGNDGWFIGGAFTKVNNKDWPYLAHILPDGSLNEGFNFFPNGSVNVLYREGNQLFVVGGFKEVNALERDRFFSIYLHQNHITELIIEADSGFNRSDIQDMVLHDGKLYISGTFERINNQIRKRLASIDIYTGQLTNWAPSVSGPGTQRINMAIKDDILYLGGWFDKIGQQDRKNLASFDLSTGNLTNWKPSTNHFVHKLLISESILIIGGGFQFVNRQTNPALAKLDLSTGELLDWNPFASHTYDVDIIDLAEKDGIVYTVGRFRNVNGKKKNNLAAFDITSGQLTEWKASSDFGAQAIALGGNHLLIGGTFKSIGGVDRINLASIDMDSGRATDWQLDTDLASRSVESFLLEDEILYIGGNFNSLGSNTRYHLASYDISNNTLTEWKPEVDLSNTAYSLVSNLVLHNKILYVGGTFGNLNGAIRTNLGAYNTTNGVLLSWEPNPNFPPNDFSINENILFIGGQFSHIAGQARSGLAAFDLTTGQLTDFALDIKIQCSTGNTGATGAFCGYTGGLNRDTILPGQVVSLIANEDVLYLSGGWSTIEGQDFNRLVSVDLQTQQINEWAGDHQVQGFHKYNEQLFMHGFFRGNLNDTDYKSLAIFDFNTSTFQELEIDVISNHLNEMAVFDDYLFLAGNITDSKVNTIRHYGVYKNDLINQNANPTGSKKEELMVKAYPNPNTGYFNLDIQNLTKESVQIDVFDNTGKLISRRNISNYFGSLTEVAFDIIEAGVYMLRVVNNRELKTIKVLVQ